MNVVNDLALWFWRLVPANPILVRVVTVGGKRQRHLFVRIGYLVALFAVMLIFGQSAWTTSSTSLAELAKQSTTTFMYVSVAQLLMMCFIAPIFTAAAITQEKDSNTLHILLTTPLSNAQIVFGSLLSRLYFVWVLLLAGVPIFCITMLFGGVTTKEVFESLGLAATTALLTGSLAIAISVVKVGTRRTILWFFVGVAVYLLAFGYAGTSGATVVPSAPLGGTGMQMSWLAPFHPFLALLVVTGRTPAPDPGMVMSYGWPWSWMLAAPQFAYMVITSLVSLLLVVVSVGFLRKSAKEGEITWLTKLAAFFTRKEPLGERRRKLRHVWENPIAWREAATRASAGGRSAARWVLMGVAILAGILLLIAHERGWWGLGAANTPLTRDWLTGLTVANLMILLLFVCGSGASSLTREKESQTMELLMTTPLTSRYIVWGTVRGLVSFALPLIIGPAAILLIVSVVDLVRSSQARPALTTPESVLLLPLQLAVFASVTALISLRLSLVSKKTVKALMGSVGAVVLFVAVAYGCGVAILNAGPFVSAVLWPMSPFHAMQGVVNYETMLGDRTARTAVPPDLTAIRVTRILGSLVWVAGYCCVAWFLYNSMVRDFDMTMRKQSA
jgi:ABC-type transport system involved in multi-copper enzyme maturation permease subunit